MLSDLQPEKFVDVDTWQVSKFETPSEKLMGKTLPRMAQLGGWALRLGALGLGMSSGTAVALGALACYVAWRDIVKTGKIKNSFVDEVWDGKLIEDQLVYKSFDVTKPAQIGQLAAVLGPQHALFVDEYKKTCAVAGFEVPPKIVIVGDRVKVWSKKNPSDPAVQSETKNQENFNFGAVTRTDGSRPIVIIGERAPAVLTPEAMRAIMAHELTHIALKHTTEDRRDGIFTGGVVFAAMTTAMALISVSAPLFAVAGLAAGLLAFDAYAGSVVARYNEKVCDRGAALMTGETVSLISGLTKMGEAMLRAKQLQDSVNSRNPKTKWQSVRDPVKKWWRKTSLFKKINHSHPDDGVRIRLLDGYGADGEDRHYLSWRAQQFRGAFLKAAVRPETVQPAAQAVARPAQTPAKPGIET